VTCKTHATCETLSETSIHTIGEGSEVTTMETPNKAMAVASIAVCGLGAASMFASAGKTGIGWATLCLMVIWVTGAAIAYFESQNRD